MGKNINIWSDDCAVSSKIFIFYNTSSKKQRSCLYRTKEDFVLTGRRFSTKGSEFPVDDSEYADDTAVLFETRTDIEVFAPLLIFHFLIWNEDSCW